MKENAKFVAALAVIGFVAWRVILGIRSFIREDSDELRAMYGLIALAVVVGVPYACYHAGVKAGKRD